MKYFVAAILPIVLLSCGKGKPDWISMDVTADTLRAHGYNVYFRDSLSTLDDQFSFTHAELERPYARMKFKPASNQTFEGAVRVYGASPSDTAAQRFLSTFARGLDMELSAWLTDKLRNRSFIPNQYDTTRLGGYEYVLTSYTSFVSSAPNALTDTFVIELSLDRKR